MGNVVSRGCPEVEELFEFLKEQDKPIAAAAYNAMICGTAKYMKVRLPFLKYINDFFC